MNKNPIIYTSPAVRARERWLKNSCVPYLFTKEAAAIAGFDAGYKAALRAVRRAK